MSVYIKGMEMPTERESFQVTIKYNGVVLDTETGIQVAEAFSVPDHGDLIDRDASLHDLRRIVLPDDLAYTIGHDMAKRFFEKAPTIIPADKEGEP